MNKAILLIISLLIISCGSRQKKTSKEKQETSSEGNTNFQQSASLQNNTEAVTDIRNFLLNKGLKITSNGLPYQFQYGDLIFSGTADVELSEKKEETILHHRYINHIKYQTQATYKTKTFFKTVQTTKKASVQRKGISFGSLVWIIICSAIGEIITWSLIKKFIPAWFNTIVKQLNKKI